MKNMTTDLLKEAIFLYPELYNDANMFIHISDSPAQLNLINEFCQWGINHN